MLASGCECAGMLAATQNVKVQNKTKVQGETCHRVRGPRLIEQEEEREKEGKGRNGRLKTGWSEAPVAPEKSRFPGHHPLPKFSS